MGWLTDLGTGITDAFGSGLGKSLGGGLGGAASDHITRGVFGPDRSGAEAGQQQNDYFNKISPNSTEFERLGVPGISAVYAGAKQQRKTNRESLAGTEKVAKIQAGAQKYSADKHLESAKVTAGTEEVNANPPAYFNDEGILTIPIGKGTKTTSKPIEEARLARKKVEHIEQQITNLKTTDQNERQKILKTIQETLKTKSEAEIKALDSELYYYILGSKGIGSTMLTTIATALGALGLSKFKLIKKLLQGKGKTNIGGKPYKFSRETGEIFNYKK